MKKICLIILIVIVLFSFIFYMMTENLKLINIRTKIYEKYGNEIEITSIQKSWKLSEWRNDHFIVFAQNKKDKIMFQINPDTLANDYAKTLYTTQVRRKIEAITKDVFGDSGECFKVEVLGKSLNDIPSKTKVTFSEYMKTYTSQVYAVIHVKGYEKQFPKEKELFMQEVQNLEFEYDYISLYFTDNEFELKGRTPKD